MKNFVLLIVAALGLAGGYLYFQKGGVAISIPASAINAAMAKSFPMSQTFFQVIDLTYSNPKVTLQNTSDRVQLAMDAKLSFKLIPGLKNLTGTTIIDSAVRYDPTKRQFFLSDPTIQKLDIAGLPKDQVDKITKIALELTKSRLEKEPIYTVEGPEAAMLAANALIKDVRVKGGAVQVVLGL